MPVTGDPQDRLIRGIVAKWSSLSGTTFSGITGLYRAPAPASITAHPYAVILDRGCDSIGHSCLSEMFESEVAISIYHKTPEQAATEIAKVDGVFSAESLSLTVSGITVMGCRLLRPAYATPAEGIWSATLEYRFQLSRTKIA